jgi:hypothetical protein
VRPWAPEYISWIWSGFGKASVFGSSFLDFVWCWKGIVSFGQSEEFLCSNLDCRERWSEVALTKALASVHPPWERSAGGDLLVTDGIPLQNPLLLRIVYATLYPRHMPSPMESRITTW